MTSPAAVALVLYVPEPPVEPPPPEEPVGPAKNAPGNPGVYAPTGGGNDGSGLDALSSWILCGIILVVVVLAVALTKNKRRM